MKAYVIQFDEEVWDDLSLTKLSKTGRKLYYHTNYGWTQSGDPSKAKIYTRLGEAKKQLPVVTLPSSSPVIMEVELTVKIIGEVTQ